MALLRIITAVESNTPPVSNLNLLRNIPSTGLTVLPISNVEALKRRSTPIDVTPRLSNSFVAAFTVPPVTIKAS